MKKIIKFIFVFMLFTPFVSLASGMYFTSSSNPISKDNNVLVNVYLNTGGKFINAVEGSINFSSDILDLKEIRSGNSLVNFWLEKPHLLNDNQIIFSGITPGGILGSELLIFSLVFNTKEVGKTQIRFKDIQIFENNGLGTKVKTDDKNLSLIISTGKIKGKNNFYLDDNEKPEDFIPYISHDPSIFHNQYFLVFSTIDKSSGVKYYKVREYPWFFFGFLGGKYVDAESPYLLKDQSLKSYIYVKAVDASLNERMVLIKGDNILLPLKILIIIGIILTICIILRKKIFFKLFS
jgi:hypothetical protein